MKQALAWGRESETETLFLTTAALPVAVLSAFCSSIAILHLLYLFTVYQSGLLCMKGVGKNQAKRTIICYGTCMNYQDTNNSREGFTQESNVTLSQSCCTELSRSLFLYSEQVTREKKCPCLHTAARIRLEQNTVARRVTTHTKALCCLSPTGT